MKAVWSIMVTAALVAASPPRRAQQPQLPCVALKDASLPAGIPPIAAACPTAAMERALRSAQSEAATAVTFTNQRAQPVAVFWINFEGVRVFYATLQPGESYTQQTFVGHPWVAATPDGHALMAFWPGSTPSTALVR